jgi:hypothetical protein
MTGRSLTVDGGWTVIWYQRRASARVRPVAFIQSVAHV